MSYLQCVLGGIGTVLGLVGCAGILFGILKFVIWIDDRCDQYVAMFIGLVSVGTLAGTILYILNLF